MTSVNTVSRPGSGTTKPKIIGAALAVYVLVSIVAPFRHWLYPGNVLWTEEGHQFSWQMMLRTKVTGVQVLMVDGSSQTIEHADLSKLLTWRQLEEMTHDPEMMREFAHFVREESERTGKGGVAVHVVALSSLNGRKPQLLVDPTVDMSRQPRTLGHKRWIMPLTEPFRWEPWDVPLSEWQHHVDLLPPGAESQPEQAQVD